MLRFDLRVGESLRIGDDVVITLEAKSGQLARLTIQAPPSVSPIRPISPARGSSPAAAPQPPLFVK